MKRAHSTQLAHLSAFFVTFIVVFILMPKTSLAQGSSGTYTFLEPLPGFDAKTSRSDLFARYAKQVFTLILQASAILGVLAITYGGIQYIMAGGSETGITAAKKRIWNGVEGFLIITLSWLILYTINPRIVSFDLCIPKLGADYVCGADAPVLLPPPAPSAAPGVVPGVGSMSCSNCQDASLYGFPAKVTGLGCKGTGECQVDAGLGEKLKQANQNMQKANVEWEVTEMYPPTRKHRDTCHKAGTCVDAAIRSFQTPENIKKAQDAFISAGLTPRYEVKTKAEADQLKSQGINAVPLGDWIDKPHFSINQ